MESITQADERVLEFLRDKGIVASPGVISANIGYNQNYISRRCRKLIDIGVLQRADATNYRITRLGERFLDGEIDKSDLEDNDGSEVAA